jgi:hypothetical protein
MLLSVADFHMHGEKSRKLSGHLVIKLCKRIYIVVGMIIIWFSPLTLNNHVVQDQTAVHHLLLGVKMERIRTDSSEIVFVTIFFRNRSG